MDKSQADTMRQAQALAQAGDMAQAETLYRAMIAADPHCHPAFQELGLLAFNAGNLPAAAALFQRAIEIDSQIALYHRNFGEIARRLARFDAAVQAGRRACRLAPADIDAHFNLALAYSDAKMTSDAAQTFRRVLALQHETSPNGQLSAPLLNMRGNILQKLDRFDEARASYERALELKPDFPTALNGLGSLLKLLGLAQQAGECFSRALQLDHGFAEARLNLGMVQLYLGQWQAGWENYEARWTGSSEHNNGTFLRPHCPLPQWNGQAEVGEQGLLVYAEQGFGDTLQFSRYLALAAQRFARIGFVCPLPNLLGLMERSFGDTVLVLKQMPTDFGSWQWHCPLMSLPRAFNTQPDTVPAPIPYIQVAQPARDYWRDRLQQRAKTPFRIGVAWAGRRSHQSDARRSLRFEQLLPLMKDARITWVSLQKQEAGDSVACGTHWIDWTSELVDFADTAALAVNLDLVVSVDSAMVHLAGALGIPVWMLNRFDSDWRWIEHREHSPWYPDLRIFNQSRSGDWVGVIQAVQGALLALQD